MNSFISPLDHRIGLGRQGEDAALQYLKSQGMTLIVRNWRCRLGELDLVMWDGTEIVFVEVKTRFATPQARKYLFDTIDHRKQRKLRCLVEVFLRSLKSRAHPQHRLDVVGVLFDRKAREPVEVLHLRAAV